jgi:hypothetical protein
MIVDDVSALHRNALAAAARGQLEDAISTWREAAHRTHTSDHAYFAILRSLESALTQQGDKRSALTVAVYSAGHDPTAWARAEAMLPHVPPVDRAMVLSAQGQWASAAFEMERAGRWAAAAVLRERTAEWGLARSLWERLSLPAESADAYVAALVRFNLARCARRSGALAFAREAAVACVHLLEEAADHFESVGQRERAFDCFQVLIEVGKDGSVFEDVLEGYVNCIRILREDHLTHFALDHFDAAIATSAASGEMNAAATFAGEAAAYARSIGMPAVATAQTMRQGELWVASSKQQAERGAPVEIVAHGLLAAIVAFAQIGQYSRVGEIYTELGLLELDARRRAHYARAARRYEGATDDALGAPNDAARLRRPDLGAGDVWHSDVVEWEQQGNAAEACADVMLERRWLDLIRRKAMLARLAALHAEAAPAEAQIAARVLLCEELGELQNYCVMAPLEKLFAGQEREVKIAVLDAVAQLFFKRSFVVVRAALRDGDPAVAAHATRALAGFRFSHAFDPLARIYRESAVAAVRAAALSALAWIDTPESVEFVLGVLAHGAPSDRAAAVRALTGTGRTRFNEIARQAVKQAPEPLRTTLRQLLAQRGRAGVNP